MLDGILLFIYLILPSHDFHTSWMTFTFNEDKSQFEAEWRTDTEHFEAVLSEFTKSEVRFDTDSIEVYYPAIQKYIQKHCKLTLNGRTQALNLEIVELNFSEMIVHFEPIGYRRKLRKISMSNSLLTSLFANQSNMVQIFYKGGKYSMLFKRGQAQQSLSIRS